MIHYKYDLGEHASGLTIKNRMPAQGPSPTTYLVLQKDGRIRWMSERQVEQLVDFLTKNSPTVVEPTPTQPAKPKRSTK